MGQTLSVDKSKIPLADQNLIEKFWEVFKKAVNNQDKITLSSLIKFPFTCDYRIQDSSKEVNENYLIVTKKLFAQRQYNIFLEPKLKKEINKHSSLWVKKPCSI